MNAPFSPRLATREPFIAFMADADGQDVVRAAATAMGWPLEHVRDGGIRSAIQTLSTAASPAVLLVDLSGSIDPREDINGLAEVCEPGTIVLACGQTNDVRLYRDLLASGIHDYLLKPFGEHQLRDVVTQAQADQLVQRERDAGPEEPKLLVGVVGVRGGVGATTLAVSTAWQLAEDRKRDTAVLDLDVHFGTGALLLDVEPGRGLTDAIENPGRIDGLFLERAVVRATDRLGVLSAETPINQPLTGDGQAFYQLQDELRAAYACTVMDLPRHMLIQHPLLLQGVGVAVVVAELTLAATRDTIRLLSWLRSNAPQTRVLLVVNRLPAGGLEEIARKDFEASVERKVDLVVPHDAKSAAQAAKLGRPLADVAKAAKAGQALAALADLVAGSEEAVPKPALGRVTKLRALLPKPKRRTPK